MTTRRGFIGGAAAAAALAGTGEAEAKGKRRKVRRADVIVVGAGLAGLRAARSVAAAGKSVVVVEARDRVGGRTLNADLGAGKVVEIGGQWVGPTQDHLLALAKDLGIETFKTYFKGQGVLSYQGSHQTFDATGPLGPIPPVVDGIADAATAIAKLDAMAKTIDVQKPWASDQADTYDGQTFETWKLDNTTTAGGRFLVDLGFTSVFAAEPRDVSLLWSVFYMASAGNETTPGSFTRLIGTDGGAQESRFVGGSQSVSIQMAKALGRRVVLKAPVRLIEQAAGSVTVKTDHRTFKGRQVIVALPPALAARIRYAPAMPFGRDQLTQRLPMGTVIKTCVVYDKPFWRDQGLAGYANTDFDAVRLTYDNSPPDGSPGILLAFIEGEHARRWGARTAADRRTQVLAELTKLYGDQAATPKRYLEKAWATEVYSRGCYGGYAPPGLLTGYGEALRAPVGRIHWAGTETSDYWNGYMDGALRSGERAAKEALADL